jgi:hypothetical protein
MKKSNFLSVLVLLILFFSCDDILEKDITDMQITIISPNEGSTIEGNTVQFLWNTIDGANDYNIQIYKNNLLIMDTLVDNSPFVNFLSSDSYQWRIKGQNEAYQSQYTFPVNFEVVSSSDLTNQAVQLNSPSNNIYTNGTSIIFTWSPVPSATSYTFELLRDTPSGSVTINLQEGLTETTLTLNEDVIDRDAKYTWRVKAKNENSQTAFFSRIFYIDTVVPPTPSLLTPVFEEEFNLSDIIVFTWDFGNDPGVIDSTITSVYEIATDSLFVNVIESGVSVPTTFSYTFNNSGTFYWRVKGEDAAGNIGTFNSNGKVIVNE